MTTPQQRQVMMLTDDHADAIRREITRTHAPVEVLNEAGQKAVFRLRRGKLVATQMIGDNVMKYEVMTQTEMERLMGSPDVSRPDPEQLEKDEIRSQLRREHPELPDQSVEVNADIIYEARKTVLRLAQQGVPPHIASKMVTGALKLTEEDRGQLENMIAMYQAEHGTAEGSSIVHVGPPTDVVPQRSAAAEPADPMGGMY